MKGFPYFKQFDKKDCGPTCLKMIVKYYGKSISLETLRKYTGITRSGVSLLGLSTAAEKVGLRSINAAITFEELMEDVDKPCIVHWDQAHFVVVTPKISKNKLVIADPAQGLVTYTRAEFKKHWISLKNEGVEKGFALLLEPTASFYELKNEGGKVVGWSLFSRYTTKYKAQVIQLFLGLILGNLLQLALPFLTQSIIDVGINTHNITFIQLILLAQFTLFFARTAIELLRSRILLFMSTHINLSILSDYWIKLMKLPLNFFDSKQIGDIFQRIGDHKRIEAFLTGTALQTIFAIFSLITFSIVLLYYNLTVFTIFFAGSLLYFFWIRFFLKYRRSLDHKNFQILSRENSLTMQLVLGMQEIKLNNAEQMKRQEWESVQASLFKVNYKALSLSQYQQIGAVFINEGKNIFITYMVATLVLRGELTLGQMLAIQYMIGQLNNPITQLVQFTWQSQDAKISIERLNEIYQLDDEQSGGETIINISSDNRDIVIEDLNFEYEGTNKQPVIKSLSTKFASGKITAIVGMSGSGKTTLLKLLLKFFQNYSGQINIGNTNLKYLDNHYWRSITGSVMQDGFIFSDSIEKNIAIGSENIDREKLLHACKVANILKFIENMPMGFSTKIGAEGSGISAGQKQRILIARAVYKDPEFIFFDEATNALDANNERVIMDNLLDFFKQRTVVIVAHRLSTVKNADKILVLNDGEIIEEGNHLELTNLKGKYYELVKNQLELGN
ncbi:ATP-binding cassette, subfamily B [Chitinophaga sp. YR573]|uniref:peptidase domain-containing ABC transporter n=1 Tax=Chitinophaga sp. YR573 TaxID=1881040 RepID=UPI0008B71C2C|nr:peptidase domain-containing ABC transporter [Chitinophaga sp. YR573]SEW17818.1 ATP-binding cassette, subfamily B [Chitinophaga sp. YR573]